MTFPFPPIPNTVVTRTHRSVAFLTPTLVWTTERPTVPGHYCYEANPVRSSSNRWEPVILYGDPVGNLWVQGIGWDSPGPLSEFDGARWAGPIPTPREPIS